MLTAEQKQARKQHVTASNVACLFDVHQCGFGRNTRDVDRCQSPATITIGGAFYCEKHCRFRQMRDMAKRRGKLVPTWRQLDLLVPPDMKCPMCRRQMEWRAGRFAARESVISLQHYNDGTIALECMTCNRLHGNTKSINDEHVAIDHSVKWCGSCQRFLPGTAFYRCERSHSKLSAHCAECNRAYHRAHYLVKGKRRRHAD